MNRFPVALLILMAAVHYWQYTLTMLLCIGALIWWLAQ